MDRKEQVLRSKVVNQVKVMWRNNGVKEATWELESDMQANYPYFSTNQVRQFRGRNLFKKG